MRADRLVAATLYLQRHGRVTAAELADHLEVSVATARRDLEALNAAGVPVYAQPGRGGGWQLVGGARTDLTGLTEPEVQALFAALGAAEASVAGAALAKLVQALPGTFRETADVAASSRRVEAHAWQRAAAPAPAAVEVLQAAILRQRGATIRYRRRGDPEGRTVAVDPWRLVDKAGLVYLLAGTERGPRTYRVDRIEHVAIDEDRAAPRPDDATIDEQWRDSTAVAEAARTSVTARVRSDPAALAVLAEMFGTGFAPGPAEGEAFVSAHSERGLAEQLAGWGSRVVVLEPAEVVEQLRTIGAELMAAYSGSRDRESRTAGRTSSARPLHEENT